MNWVDYAILAVIAVSALISLIRGFVREVLSIIIWVGALWLAYNFAGQLAPHFESYIESAAIRGIAAFLSIFVGTLLLGVVVNYLAAQLVGKTGLTWTDRMIGIGFGVGRGVLLVGVVVLLVGLTAIVRETWWRDSLLVAQFQPWVCRFQAGEMLGRIKLYTPLAGEGAPASSSPYWGEFCGSGAMPESDESARVLGR